MPWIGLDGPKIQEAEFLLHEPDNEDEDVEAFESLQKKLKLTGYYLGAIVSCGSKFYTSARNLPL